MLQQTIVDDKGELRTESEADDLHRLRIENDGLKRELDAAQDLITGQLIQIKALKTRNAKEDARIKNRETINEVGENWKEICNKKNCKIQEGKARFKAIREALADGYTPEHIRVACLGAMHNNPWKPKSGQKPMLEIATFCRDGSWLEQFHDAGCDWLEANGHPTPERFSGPSSVMAKTAEDFRKANQTFIIGPDGRSAEAVCPVTVEGMRVELEDGRARFVCPSGCDRDIIVAALKLKQGRGGH